MNQELKLLRKCEKKSGGCGVRVNVNQEVKLL